MDDLWTTKYLPTKIDDIIGNRDGIQFIQNWLANFQKTKNSSIVICGPHGIGKSITIKLLLEEQGYDVKFLSSPNIKQSKILKDVLQPSASNIHLLFDEDKQTKYCRKSALVIDDSETITLSSEKNILFQVFKDNESKKMFPLIFLTNEQHNKLVSDIRKACPEIKFNYPTPEEMISFVKSTCNKENMIIDDIKTIHNIVKFSQFDIRRLLLIIQDLKLTYGNNNVGPDEWKKYISSSQKKDKDIGLFDATKNILDNYKNIDTCLQLYETEKVLLPLMVFENYPRNVLARNCPSPNDLLKTMKHITNSISLGDVIETNIYTDQNWYLQNLHGFYTCVETSYLLNKYPKKNTDYQHIDFSSDLNKTSLKNINKKNIASILSDLPNKNLIDILYLNTLINYNVKNDKFQLLHELTNDYNINTKMIELIMKVDKTLEKVSITTKNKKLLQK